MSSKGVLNESPDSSDANSKSAYVEDEIVDQVPTNQTYTTLEKQTHTSAA